MFVVLEVSAPDSPRSVDLETVREAITEHLTEMFDGYRFTVECESPNMRVHDIECDLGCIQALDDRAASAAGFTIDPDEV